MEVDIKYSSLPEKQKVIRPEETTKIKCSNCEKALADITSTVLSDKIFYNLIIECPFCKDKSFSTQIKGKIGIRPVDGIQFTEIDTDNQTMTNFYRTVKMKNG